MIRMSEEKIIFPGREVEAEDPNKIECPFCNAVYFEEIEVCEQCGASINGSFNKWFNKNKRVFYP